MYKKELEMQLRVAKTYKSLNNDDINSIFLKLKEKDIRKIASKYGDLDSQSTLMKEVIKNGLLFSVLPKIISRRIFGL